MSIQKVKEGLATDAILKIMPSANCVFCFILQGTLPKQKFLDMRNENCFMCVGAPKCVLAIAQINNDLKKTKFGG